MGQVHVLGIDLKLGSEKFAKGLRRGEYKLAKLKAKSSQYKDRINRDSRFLGQIRDQKPKDKVRLVTATWIVVSAELASQIERGIRDQADFSLEGVKFEIDWSANATEDVSVSFSEGSVFAYEVSRVKWSQGRKKIDDLKVDLAGILN